MISSGVPYEVRKAALLAAGRGTRLGPLTAHTPKPLLEVAGAPLIAHIVGSLFRAGIVEIAVVTGYLGEKLGTWCEEFGRPHPELRLVALEQPELNGTAGAMVVAKGFLAGEKAFVFGWGDILMDHRNYVRFVKAARSVDYDLLLAINHTPDPWRGAAVYVTGDMRVERLIEKPPRGTSTTNWNNAGLFAATQCIFDYLARLRPGPRGELELPEAIAMMIADGLRVRALDVRGFWSDVGTPEDLDLAQRHFRSGDGDEQPE